LTILASDAFRVTKAMLVKKVREFIKSKGLLAPGDSVLVGVSGGADSVALLHVLFELNGEMDFTLAVAHLNHGLRDSSAQEDCEYVKGLCENLGLSCCVDTSDVPAFAESAKLSIEEAARELRYEFLRKTAAAGEHNKVALGHTRNDQAETVLMRLIRGAGVRGLAAMNPMSGGLFVRPLLTAGRSEVLEFLDSRKIAYREDLSNLDTAFLRNRIRHELLEILRKDYNARIVDVLCSHAAVLSDVEDYLSTVAAKAYEGCVIREAQENIELELPTFLTYHKCVQGYIFREAYRRLCGSLRNLDFCHVASLLKLASSGQPGNSVDVPSGMSAWLDGKSVLIGYGKPPAAQTVTPEFIVQFEPGSAVWVPEISLGVDSKLFTKEQHSDDFTKRESDRALFDFEKLEPPFALRNLNPGDRIAPFGMRGSKKVQDLLVDMKVPRNERRRLAAFCDRSQILWLVGTRRGQAAPVTERTRVILELRAVTQPEGLRQKES